MYIKNKHIKGIYIYIYTVSAYIYRDVVMSSILPIEIRWLNMLAAFTKTRRYLMLGSLVHVRGFRSAIFCSQESGPVQHQKGTTVVVKSWGLPVHRNRCNIWPSRSRYLGEKSSKKHIHIYIYNENNFYSMPFDSLAHRDSRKNAFIIVITQQLSISSP